MNGIAVDNDSSDHMTRFAGKLDQIEITVWVSRPIGRHVLVVECGGGAHILLTDAAATEVVVHPIELPVRAFVHILTTHYVPPKVLLRVFSW